MKTELVICDTCGKLFYATAENTTITILTLFGEPMRSHMCNECIRDGDDALAYEDYLAKYAPTQAEMEEREREIESETQEWNALENQTA